MAQGDKHGVRSTDTIDLIHKHKVPQGKTGMYASFVIDYRPLKVQPHRVLITVGGDKLPFEDDAGSPVSNFLETKVLTNSTITDASKGAKFVGADISDYFLATPMKKSEYMQVRYKHIPTDIKERYSLEDKVTTHRYIYIRIKKVCMA